MQYWGVYPLKKSEVVGIAKQGWLAMNIMAHDLPCDREAEFYKNQGINTYVNTGADDPDKSYFLRMFLSCSRAVDYLAGRSDWNKPRSSSKAAAREDSKAWPPRPSTRR